MTHGSAPTARRSLGYLPQLDTLRAVAVTIVMWWHFGRWSSGAERLAIELGVRLFFVLSGFLITAILLMARDTVRAGESTRAAALARFYVRRALRIAPIFYLTLLVTAALGLPTVREAFWWHAAYLSNVRFVTGSFTGPLIHFWTLSVEEQFYLLWPWVVLGAAPARVRQLAVAAVLVAPIWRAAADLSGHPLAGALLLPGSLDSLCAGAWMAAAWHAGTLADVLRRARPYAVAAAVSVVCVVATGYAEAPGVAWVRPTLATVVLAQVVGEAAVGLRGAAGRALLWGPARYVGRISYGLYVYHNFMWMLVPWLGQRLGVWVPRSGWRHVALQFAASLALASLSWHVVERPFTALKSRWE